MKLSAIVLAAGQGTRMKSALPKPLHRVCGRSMVHWILEALRGCDTDHHVLVVGHGGDEVTASVKAAAPDLSLTFVTQQTQRGTGDAASVGLTGLPEDLGDDNLVLILAGDTPLIRPETLAGFVDQHRATDASCTILTADVPDPTGYGRIIRDADGNVERIVEHRDATDEERRVTEMNTGVFCFKQSLLAPALRRVTPTNDQGEFYLTDVVEVLRSTGHRVGAWIAPDPAEMEGVNDRAHLAAAESVLRARINGAWLRSGVAITDPAATYIDVTVEIEPDATIHPGSMLLGDTVIEAGAVVGPNATLIDSVVGANARVPSVWADRATFGEGSSVAPFSVIAPGDEIS